MGKLTYKFQNIVIPPFYEVANEQHNFYTAGKDNKYFDYLIYLYKNSSTHSAMVNNIAQRIKGGGFQSDNPIDQANIEKYKINEWLDKSAKNLSIYDSLATEIIWTPLHEYINSFYSVNIDRVRVGLFETNDDEPTLFLYSPSWSEMKYITKNSEIEILRKFDTDPDSDKHQMLYNFGVNRVGNDVYGRPDYASGIHWIETDIAIPKFYMNLIHNNFNVSNLLVVPYQPDEAVRKEFEEGLKEQFVGTENAGSTMVVYAPDGGQKVELIRVAGEQGEHKYDELLNLTIESIARNHGYNSPMLAGISLPGNLYGVSDMAQIEHQFNKQVIYPKRKLILDDFNKINKHLRTPIVKFDIKDLNSFDEKTN